MAGKASKVPAPRQDIHFEPGRVGKLNKGESLSCKEPIVNLFDGTTVGKAVSVDLTEKENGTFFGIASATWTPAN